MNPLLAGQEVFFQMLFLFYIQYLAGVSAASFLDGEAFWDREPRKYLTLPVHCFVNFFFFVKQWDDDGDAWIAHTRVIA